MSNKTIVIYKSKSGFTKKYAEWIAEELQCDIKENNKLSLSDIAQYDTIIYGGALYASTIRGIKLIKNNFEALKDKNLIVFATGMTTLGDETLAKVWEFNFNEEQRQKIKLFYFKGGFDYSKLSIGSKIIVNMMKEKIKSEVGMQDAFDKRIDFTDRNNIIPLVKLV